MIPKIIHYVWVGHNPKSKLIQECIATWKEKLPDYQFIEWNEDNFDVESVRFTKEAYEAKKWAFVSDYVRLYALFSEGGIYLDTDNELLKSMDAFLSNQMFTGFESKDSPVTAVIGAEKGNAIIKGLMNAYTDRSFMTEGEDEKLVFQTNTLEISDYFMRIGIKPNGKLQCSQGLTVYPQIVFCPNNMSRIWNKTSNKSYAIHHFDQSWKEESIENRDLKYRLRRYIIGLLRNVIGTKRLIILSDRGKR